MRRRAFLQLLGGAAGLAACPAAWAVGPASPDEFFVFVHAAGGWDVTLWADPRNERRGLVEPASTDNTDPGGLPLWRPARLGGGAASFEILAPAGSALRLGPAIGDLYDLRDRLTIVNGLAMNTVSHEDGTAYATTGRHRAGAAPSVDVLVTDALGTGQLMPDVAVRFPSAYAGDRLDRRAIPLRVGSVDAITRVFARSDHYLLPADRADVAALLTEEAAALGGLGEDPETYRQLAGQHRALPGLLGGAFVEAFAPAALRRAYPRLDRPSRTQAGGGLAAAFAVEAIRRNVVRCVGFALGGLDTHGAGYRQHAQTLADLFGVVAAMVRYLDEAPHPTRPGARLSEHTHVLVVSEFCRTPQVNAAGGRDHYPNNSALVISPRFRGGRVVGATDPEQLLPVDVPGLPGGPRPIAPPDLLATYLTAFGIDPRRHLRDGAVIPGMLA